jgi:hypothetical protein
MVCFFPISGDDGGISSLLLASISIVLVVDTFGVCRDPQGHRCYFLSMGFLSMKFLDVCLRTLLLVVP